MAFAFVFAALVQTGLPPVLQPGPPPAALPSPRAAIHGTVSTADGRPLEGVLVVKGRDAMAVTDEHGAFLLTLPADLRPPLIISASLPGYNAVEITIADVAAPAIFTLSSTQPTFRTSVTASATAVDPAAASRTVVSPLDVVRTAGTQADVMRDLATMPGVTTIDGGTGLFVRGGDVSEVQVLFDGVVVTHPYRDETPTGGFRGAVDPFLTKDTTFTTGGFGAPYGNALSAVVDFTPQDRPRARAATASFGLAGASVSAAQPLGEASGLRLAITRSTPSLLFAVNSSAEPFDRYPGGWDASGAWYAESPTLGSMRIFALHQADHVGVQIQHDAFTGFLHSSTTHTFVAAHWQKALPSRWLASASVGADEYSTIEDAGVLHLDDADANRSARFDLSGGVGAWSLHAGHTLDVDRPNETGRVPISGGDFGGVGGVKTFAVTSAGWTTGTFADVTRTFGRLSPEVGVRADYYSHARAWTIDPRTQFVFSLNANQRLRLAIGRYHQAPSSAYFDRESGAASLPPMQAWHAILGYERGAPNGPSFFRIEAYDKRYAYLPLQTSNGYDASGYGSARGIDVFGTRAWRALTLRANASWLTAARRWTPWDQQNTYPVPASGTWRPDFDIPYSVELVSTITLSPRWSVDTAWRAAGGRPSTPAIGAVPTSSGYVPVWGAINSERLPGYDRFDISISRSLRFGPRSAIAFLSVGNLLDHVNVSSYSYTADYTGRTPVPSGSPRNVYVGMTVR